MLCAGVSSNTALAFNACPQRADAPHRASPLNIGQFLLLGLGLDLVIGGLAFCRRQRRERARQVVCAVGRLCAVDRASAAEAKILMQRIANRPPAILGLQINQSLALAWRHVQELGFVLNYVSVEERLPTTKMSSLWVVFSAAATPFSLAAILPVPTAAMSMR